MKNVTKLKIPNNQVQKGFVFIILLLFVSWICVLKTSLQFRLQKWGIWNYKILKK